MSDTNGDQKVNVIERVDPRYFFPVEVRILLGDQNKAKHKLGWMPNI